MEGSPYTVRRSFNHSEIGSSQMWLLTARKTRLRCLNIRRSRLRILSDTKAWWGKCQDLDLSSAFNSCCFINFPVLVMSGDFDCDCQFYLCIALGNACIPQGKQQRAQAQQCCAQHPNTQDLCWSTLGAFNCGVHHLALVHFITAILGWVVSPRKTLRSEKTAEFLEWLLAACLSDWGNKKPSVLLWKKTKVKALRKICYWFKK